jgi:prolyl 4-hydroxylase
MSQSVTPELRHWIREQSAANLPPDAVVAAMVKVGWQPAVAAAALAQVMREQPGEPLAAPPSLPSLPSAAAVQAAGSSAAGEAMATRGARMPEVNMRAGSLRANGGDRQVRIIASLQSPRVVLLADLLSPEECDALMAAARPRMARSLTVQTQTGGEELNPDRTSNGMFFSRGETPLLERMEARIAELLQWPVENGEGMQVLHYRPGAEYKPHYDYFDPAEPGTPAMLQRGGQRLGTLVIYLNEPEEGGGTTFPDLGLEVAPQRGNAVFFRYDRPAPSTKTLHGGAPVIRGEKWVATKWLRQCRFD